jgi:hypothetical protein
LCDTSLDKLLYRGTIRDIASVWRDITTSLRNQRKSLIHCRQLFIDRKDPRTLLRKTYRDRAAIPPTGAYATRARHDCNFAGQSS